MSQESLAEMDIATNEENALHELKTIIDKKIKLYILENNKEKDCLEMNYFYISDHMWNYLNNITKKLNTKQFFGYFYKTLSIYTRFKNKEMKNQIETNDYFRRCQLISILQLMGMISKSLPQFVNTIGLIKIGPSKNGVKKCCIIDDSTVMDKETNEIRESNGSPEEPHRGYKLFNSLSKVDQGNTIYVLDYMLNQFNKIIDRISSGQYTAYDPIMILQRIIYYYCIPNNFLSILNCLACEIHDDPYTLTQEERNNLFKDYDELKLLWNSNFINNNHGKFRLYILCFFYIDLVCTNKIKEIF